MVQFDKHIFQMGWNQQTDRYSDKVDTVRPSM